MISYECQGKLIFGVHALFKYGHTFYQIGNSGEFFDKFSTAEKQRYACAAVSVRLGYAKKHEKGGRCNGSGAGDSKSERDRK
ncbi:hypothetical protein AALB53_14535 [Lachnospiraceae bacterium 47-T17]